MKKSSGITPNPPSFQDCRRIAFLALALLAPFCLVIMQFYKLQIMEEEKWVRYADLQHEKIVVEPFKRGVFYSNPLYEYKPHEKPQALVRDIEKFHLFLDPYQIPLMRREEIIESIGKITPVPVDSLLHFDGKSRYKRWLMWLDVEVKDAIWNWWLPYSRKYRLPRNALFFEADWRRSYPFGSLMGQVLHTIQDLKEEGTRQGVPTGGLEMQFNDLLKGKSGKRLLLHSPRNPLEMGQILQKPQNGADVYLTINHCLQAIAEEELSKGVQKAKAKGGLAIMMDPFTGHILALAQYPFFNPSHYREYFNDPVKVEHTKVKAITDAHEVGSIMKPITLAICLQANEECRKKGLPLVFDPDEKMATDKGNFPGRGRPLKDTTLHYFLNMELALQKSSNIYMAKIVERLLKAFGADWYRQKLSTVFGFGRKTGIELPAEACGLLPTPGKKHASGKLEWSTPTPYSLAFGHNLLATSMQMTTAYAILANGGMEVKPTIVCQILRKKENGDVEVLLDNTRWHGLKKSAKLLQKSVADRVVKSMKYVTKPGGTAVRGDIPGYTEAGKTATAEKIIAGSYSKSHYFSSFVGFAPLSHPCFVLFVAMDEPECAFLPGIGKTHHGGVCAAPVFTQIAKRALEYLGVPPDDPYGYPFGDPRRDSEKADWMREAKRLKELYEKWNKRET